MTGYTSDGVTRVTELPGAVEVREAKLRPHEDLARALCAELAGAARSGAQACYLPLTPDGELAVGKVPSAEGVFIGAGHSCWGILNGPATGKALSELVLDGAPSCVPGLVLAAFDPARFAARR